MDTKRLILAIVLSIVVITLFQLLFMSKPKPTPPTAQQPATQQQSQPVGEGTAKKDTTQAKDLADLFASKKEKAVEVKQSFDAVTEDIKGTEVNDNIEIKSDLFTAVFTNKGAGLKSFVLNRYKDDGDVTTKGKQKHLLNLVSQKVEKFQLLPFHFFPYENNPLYKQINENIFTFKKFEQNGKTVLLFEYKDQATDLSVVKKFTFNRGSYVINLEHKIIKERQAITVPFTFGPDLENNISPARTLQQGLKIGAFNGEDVKSVDFRKLKTEPIADNTERAQGTIDGFFYWAAYETTYFAAIFKTDNKNAKVRYRMIKNRIIENKKAKWDIYSYMVVENPTAVYMGPKDEEILATITGTFYQVNEAIQYGWFGSIAKIMQKGISIAHRIVPNYGWAIILFTLFLKLLLFPLTYTSSVSMAKMQALQPKIKAIRKKYKNPKEPQQRQQMQKETMELYKKEKVNPMGGCLPLLLQLPILWGLFRFLAVSINVRHEPWLLYIKDLSLKDPIYLIPILMGASQILLQKMSPTSGDASQSKMMYLMPVVITFFVMSLPSGLTLYWFVSNLLQIGQQHFINKRIFQKRKDEESQRKAFKRKKGAKLK